MPRVLIVDDHAGYRQRLVAAAQEMGFEIVGECANGEETVSLFAREKPDCVVLDLHLPGEVSGLETAHVLLQIEDRALLVAASPFTDAGELTRAFDAGFHRCLRKPFRTDEALRLFENLAEELRSPTLGALA